MKKKEGMTALQARIEMEKVKSTFDKLETAFQQFFVFLQTAGEHLE